MSNIEMTPEERYEKFKTWLDYMPHALEDWNKRLPKDLQDQLDYSIESINHLETFLLNEFTTAEEAFKGENYLISDGAARYIGESFRKNYGAVWGMDVNDPNSLVFVTPSMRGFPKAGPPVAPIRLVVNTINKRKSGYLAFIVKHLN